MSLEEITARDTAIRTAAFFRTPGAANAGARSDRNIERPPGLPEAYSRSGYTPHDREIAHPGRTADTARITECRRPIAVQ